MFRKTNFAILSLVLLLSASFANAALIDIDTSYDLSAGLDSFATLDDGPVAISNGDTVDMTVNFTNNQALTIGDSGEYLSAWLFAGDNNSSFSIVNIAFEFLGFSSTGGVSSTYNLAAQNSGQAHLGPHISNFLAAGQSISFSGFRVTYDVVSIAQSPHEYASLWLRAGGNTSVGEAVSVPEPSIWALFLVGLVTLGFSRKKIA